MANTKSALKRVRQTKTRTLINQGIKTRVKTARKAFTVAVESGDAETIATASRKLFSRIDRAVKVGVMHQNVSSRVKSRVAKLLRKQVNV